MELLADSTTLYRIWNEAVVISFEILPRDLPANEENHECITQDTRSVDSDTNAGAPKYGVETNYKSQFDTY